MGESHAKEFHRAARHNDVDAARKILSEHPAVLDSGQGRALSGAARYGHREMVQFLLEAGADPNLATPRSGWTPLALAEFGGHLEVAQMLRAHGAKEPSEEIRESIRATLTPKCPGCPGGAELQLAALQGDLERVRRILDEEPDLVNVGTDEFTPLHRAAQNGHVEVVKLLIERGADIDAPARYDETPMLIAKMFGQRQVWDLLAEAGASEVPHVVTEAVREIDEPPDATSAENLWGHWIEHKDEYADLPAVNDAVEYVLNARAVSERSPVRGDIRVGFAKGRVTTDSGESYIADVRVVMRASTREFVVREWDTVDDVGGVLFTSFRPDYQKMLARGYDIDDIPEEDVFAWLSRYFEDRILKSTELSPVMAETPAEELRNAARHNDVDRARAILGRYPEALVASDVRPLVGAARYGHVEMVRLLVDAGAETNSAHSRTGWTALALAEFAGHTEVAELLRARGAEKPTDAVRQSITARLSPKCPGSPRGEQLQRAAQKGDLETLRRILDQEPNLLDIGEGDWTALHCAAQHGHVEVVKLLLERGANMNAEAFDHTTPMLVARMFGQQKVRDLLNEAGASEVP